MMFEFHWPLCFLLLPLPWLYRRWLPPAETRSAALQVGFMERLQALQPLAAQPGSPGRKWPYLVVWALLVVAAARPQLLGDSLPTAVTGRDMMLALDLSGESLFVFHRILTRHHSVCNVSQLQQCIPAKAYTHLLPLAQLQ